MNREADQVIRVKPPLKRKLDKRLRRLQLDLGRAVTYSEMLDAQESQIVYEHVREALEGGQP